MPTNALVQRQTLHQAYRQLTDVQKSIVQIFALLYEPTNCERARFCWSEAMLYQHGRSDPFDGLDGQQFGHF